MNLSNIQTTQYQALFEALSQINYNLPVEGEVIDLAHELQQSLAQSGFDFTSSTEYMFPSRERISVNDPFFFDHPLLIEELLQAIETEILAGA